MRLTPTPAGFGVPVLVRARSATALTVVLTFAVLFPGTGSVSLAETAAVLVTVAGAAIVTLTTMVTVALAPFAKLPRVQEIAAVPVQVP